MKVLFNRYRELVDRGEERQAERYRLFGVRLDTSGSLKDVGTPQLGDPARERGVTPELVSVVRTALDNAFESWDLPAGWLERAAEYTRSVKIVATGGFDPERIARFEKQGVAVDIYGVGSYLLSSCTHCGTSNDFTADVVRIEIDGDWIPMAKVGRAPGDNPDLKAVEWNE
jgi:nicotinate phosphoribosyltransferase